MNYLPAWVFCIPDKDDPNYEKYLREGQAVRDGVPEYTINHLIKILEKQRNERNSD